MYIYHGGKSGISAKASQIFGPADFSRSGQISTFGFSLSGGLDLDKNGYPDLLVGAYGSNKALYFRSRPIIHIKPQFKIDANAIRLEDEGCLLPDGTTLPWWGSIRLSATRLKIGIAYMKDEYKSRGLRTI